jgi:type VI secretion system protein ImpK
MLTTKNTDNTQEEHRADDFGYGHTTESQIPLFTLTKNTAVETHSNQTLLHSKFITHNPKAGVNPLVDAAAYLFSSIGKLTFLKSHRNLVKLQKDLINEINTFQETAKAQGYTSEYILVCRYAVCATVDDIITHTTWGGEGQWENYSVLGIFNQEAPQPDRFFLILERIIKDPALYIDVMEFMYICLSLGYKGNYRTSSHDNQQLETITHSLYRHIRGYHGDYPKGLSPFPIKPAGTPKKSPPKVSYTFTFLTTASVIMLLFIGFGCMLDTFSNRAYQELMRIGKSIVYETTL